MYLENLKDVGDRLSRRGGGIRTKEVQATIRLKRERAIEAYLDVETMFLMKIIKWQRRKQKRLPGRLNIRIMMIYIANWVRKMEKKEYL